MNLLNRLLGTATTNEHRYECECGAPMTNTGARSYDDYRVELWQCTDEDCSLSGRALIFDEPGDSYGEGVLAGKVTP